MRATPDLDGFRAAYEAGAAQVVWTTLVADLETPVSAFLKLADGRRFSCLFESVEGGATIGRYSFIGLKPDLIWRCHGARAEINRSARSDPAAFEPLQADTLESLRDLVAESRIDLPDGGEVNVTGRRNDRYLELTISNPVAAGEKRATGGNKMALANIRQRFELAYGNRATVDVSQGDDTYSVTLRFPIDEDEA